MTELYQIIVLRAGVVLLALLAAVSAFVGLSHACRCVGRQLKTLTLVVISFLAIVATVLAQKSGRSTGTTGIPPGTVQQTGTTGVPPVGNEITNTLHFAAIDVHTNGTATLLIAWPPSLLAADATLDLFAATSLVNSTWVWQCEHQVAACETNWVVAVALPQTSPGTNAPSAFFYVSNRETCADTMDDLDGDGLPNAYELAHNTNPYVQDYASAFKLTVGPGGDFADIQSALAASTNYSIIELDSATRHDITDSLGVQLPQHPVMVTASNSCAVVRATGTSAFMLANGSSSRTLFQNLYLLLDAKGSFQTGFWCGGSLPWLGIPASATFENVYVRMPNPGVQYRGWIFYRNCADRALIRNCTVNAAGATWAIGIEAYDSPPLAVDRCSFVNFPPDSSENTGCCALLRTSGTGDGGSEVTFSRSLFDESFTNAWPLARFDSANPYSVTFSDCLAPSGLPAEYPPNISSNIVVTNSALTWSGIPYPDSPSVALGVGSLMPIANNPSVDTDGDGLCDYDEAYELGTDPFNADSDNDGVDDYTEIYDGTDPSDPHSFMQRLTVTVTNTASLAHAVYTAWGNSPTGWVTSGLATFSQGFGETIYTNASSQGATHVKAFCDLNGNGTFDTGYDILLSSHIPTGSTAHVAFTFGDVDGDGVSDVQEREEETDPYDAGNFMMHAKFKFTDQDVGHGCTNYVAVSLTESEWNLAEVVMSSASSTFEFEVHTNVTQGAIYVKCLHDRDGDGLLDVGIEGIRTNRLFRSVGTGSPIEMSIGDYDYDGVCDTQELLDGTEPFDWRNFRIRTRIDIADSDDDCGITNYVTIAQASDDWISSAVVTSFTGYAATVALDRIVTNGYLYVRCLRDLDRDGVFGTADDLLYRASVGNSWNGKRYHLGIGDIDGDGIIDSIEEAEGTDPHGATNYCFNLSATVTSIFLPSNGLKAVACFGDEASVLYGPTIQSGTTLAVNFGHLSTVSRQKVSFLFWEDLDGNGAWDEGERRTTCEFSVTGHDMCVTNSLGLGEFDADGDGMLDDWELQHGLSPTNAIDATQDADGDGHINLYEYWSGTAPDDPLDYESETALVAGSRSVDDRIVGKQPTLATPYYNGFGSGSYPGNTPLTNLVFTLNTDCWMYGVDLSFMSIWSDDPDWPWAEPLTLISPLHVMSASHVTPPNGTHVVFRSFTGNLYVRMLVDSKPIYGVAANDLCVGILDEPLPSDIKIARFLPPEYSSYIGIGRKLPYVRIGREKQCAIEDVVFLAPTSMTSEMIKIEHSANYVRNQYQRPPVSMDSGHPISFLFGDELAFLCPTRGFRYSDGLATGYLCSLYLDMIQATMDFLSDTTGETRMPLRIFDLTAYPHLNNCGGLE